MESDGNLLPCRSVCRVLRSRRTLSPTRVVVVELGDQDASNNGADRIYMRYAASWRLELGSER